MHQYDPDCICKDCPEFSSEWSEEIRSCHDCVNFRKITLAEEREVLVLDRTSVDAPGTINSVPAGTHLAACALGYWEGLLPPEGATPRGGGQSFTVRHGIDCADFQQRAGTGRIRLRPTKPKKIPPPRPEDKRLQLKRAIEITNDETRLGHKELPCFKGWLYAYVTEKLKGAK